MKHPIKTTLYYQLTRLWDLTHWHWVAYIRYQLWNEDMYE